MYLTKGSALKSRQNVSTSAPVLFRGIRITLTCTWSKCSCTTYSASISAPQIAVCDMTTPFMRKTYYMPSFLRCGKNFNSLFNKINSSVRISFINIHNFLGHHFFSISIKVRSYYAAIALRCRTAPSYKEIAM